MDVELLEAPHMVNETIYILLLNHHRGRDLQLRYLDQSEIIIDSTEFFWVYLTFDELTDLILDCF